MSKRSARLNVQGLARRSKELMGCLLPEEGQTLVSIDLSAGEPTVTSHYSGDENYRYATLDGVGKRPFYKDGTLFIDDIYLHVASVSPIGKQAMLEAWSQAWPIGTFADQWVVDSEVIKSKLKSIRQLHKILCVGGSTLVAVKGRGYVPISKVTPGSLIWDGEAWVTCQGVICNGEKETIDVYGEYATNDHQFLGRTGWARAEEIKRDFRPEDLERLQRPSFGWADVWRMASSVLRDTNTWRSPVYLCRWGVWAGMETIRQFKLRKVHPKP